jgi:cytidine deaminase
LIQAAGEARERAYIPYSRFGVGAALLAEDGRLFTGCNVENASFGLTCCAERTAIFKAVSEGCRRFAAIAVIAEGERPVSPCGACRQVMAEFAPGMRVLLANLKGETLLTSVAELLPGAFSPEDLPPTG